MKTNPLEQFNFYFVSYAQLKAKTLLYRVVFGAIGTTLLLLACIVLIQSPNWICDLYVGYYWVMKTLVGGFSALLGSLSFFLAYSLRPEKEALLSLRLHAHRKLRQLYHHARIQCSAPPLWWLSEHPALELLQLRKRYREAKHRLVSLVEERRIYLQHVAYVNSAQPEIRDDLFYQALTELAAQMQAVVNLFAKNSLSPSEQQECQRAPLPHSEIPDDALIRENR